MIITAKFASVCPCCNSRIVPGSKVDWTKGSPAKHTACSGAGARPAGRRTSSRGRWNGCACGAREMPDGSLSANACDSCRYDHE